ncbi:hypothetical protein EVAR_17857_1 [Eumeta japonica]|uniref:Uncharacterized protein n=1 Tax=Eumeta variegata TaxID=151549 RepID=A0A4C1TTR6_EUMVA|nr:hypothetical protein EVAR_17857_1 [Eumeta japonica]
MITGDESWIYCYDREAKCQYALWAFPLEELLIKLKQDRSVGKKMAGPFFGMTAHYATIVLEGKKQSLQTGALTIVCLFWERFRHKNTGSSASQPQPRTT